MTLTLAQGHNNAEIVERLGLSGKTVRNHVSNIFSNPQVANRAEAIIRARPAQAEFFDVLTEELEARPGLSGTLNRALRAKTNEPPQPGRLACFLRFSRSATTRRRS